MDANTKFETVDQYISGFIPSTQTKLRQLRSVIRKTAPQAEECISYNMPTYKMNGPLVYFAGYKNHIGFYPLTTVLKVFKDELTSYKQSKGTVQFPLDKPIPLDLVRRMVSFRIKENQEKAAAKIRSKKQKAT